jgi:uncharacterized protein (DUF885 family)
VLDQTEYVTGADAYLAWLQERQDEAVERLDGVPFDIAPPLRRIEAVLARGSSSGAAYYTKPSEDLARPGRTWWPLAGRGDADRFPIWSELSTVFHEGVPGHHLQAGAAMMAGDTLSRYAKCMFVSGHGEGWALYAERLADELGWPGQAISYKLGERGWLAAREQAMRRPAPGGSDLKQWHTAALNLGPIGLDGLTEALARIGDDSG